MAAPTFVQEAEVGFWNSASSPRTTGSFNVLAGDLLIAAGVCANGTSADLGISGGSLTWTPEQVVSGTNFTEVRLWSAVVDVDKSMTVSFTRTGSSVWFGGNCLTWRDHSGVGASAGTTFDEGAPTLDITTTQAESAIVVVNGDIDATTFGSRTWRTNAGALTEVTFFDDDITYSVYIGYHANAGAAGTYAVGLSVPTGQTYSIAAVEVKGIGAGAGEERWPFLRRPTRFYRRR